MDLTESDPLFLLTAGEFMATSREYLDFILDQLSGLDGITHRQMMGEYIIYYKGRICAYLCDDRFLAKPVAALAAKVAEATPKARDDRAHSTSWMDFKTTTSMFCSLMP